MGGEETQTEITPSGAIDSLGTHAPNARIQYAYAYAAADGSSTGTTICATTKILGMSETAVMRTGAWRCSQDSARQLCFFFYPFPDY